LETERFHGEIEQWQEEAFRLGVTTTNANCCVRWEWEALHQQWLLLLLQWQVQLLGWQLLLLLQLQLLCALTLPPALRLQLQQPLQLQLEPLQLAHLSSCPHSLDATLSAPHAQLLKR